MQPSTSTQDASARPVEAWPLRGLRLALGWLWAMVLALAGLGVWTHRQGLLDILPPGGSSLVVAATGLCLAGAQFVFMMLVADALCPRPPAMFVTFLKTFTGAILWMSLGWLALTLWRLLG